MADSSNRKFVVIVSSSAQCGTARNDISLARSYSCNVTVPGDCGRMTGTAVPAGGPRQAAGSITFTQCSARSTTAGGGTERTALQTYITPRNISLLVQVLGEHVGACREVTAEAEPVTVTVIDAGRKESCPGR